ncbi:probable aldolase (plasmid) [Rhodococcus jostii RHA1]|uniref:Probable aldolase n=1 Tax=Rhodococcus jostii (strain RHA1) TaxID=101510 RepID=Q0RXG7_RHOJR|nr:probable aldolase [Rhodococcus jostii RHA1]
MTLIDLAGHHRGGPQHPTSEIDIHLGVYRSTDACAVVHAHASAAIALSLVADELPPYQQLLLGGALPVSPFAPFGTEELAESVPSALRGKNAAILAHHGSVAVGATLTNALDNILLLEWLCGMYLAAAAVGTPRALTDAQMQAMVEIAVRTNYGNP